MATTFVEYTGDGNATKQFTFPSIQESDVKVRVDDVLKTTSTHYNITSYTTTGGGNVVFTAGNIPSNPAKIRIYRDTNVDVAKATYTPGSSVKAADLNNNNTQLLYRAQEEQVPNLIQTYDIVDDILTTAKIVDQAVTSDKIADGTIVNADINTSADIAVSKLANGTARQLLQTNAGGNGVEFTSNVDVPGTLDVTNAATFDNTVTIGGAVTVNNTTTLDNTTVDGVLDVNGSATIDDITIDGSTFSKSTGTIRILSDTIELDGDLRVRPNGVGIRFMVDDTVVQTLVDFRPYSTNQYDLGSSSRQFKDLYIDGTAYLDSVDVGSLSGSAIKTSGTGSDTQVYSAAYSDSRYFNVGTAEQIGSGQTWSSVDNKFATTAAIDARIIDLVDEVGGFVPIANETSFPNFNPDINNGAGTLVSVPLANNLTSNSSGVITIANGTVGNSTVTITGAGDTKTYTQGFGIIVETTSTLNTYTFHRYVPKATEVTTVAGNVGNVNTVAGSIANVNSVGGNIANVNSVAGNATNINSAVSNASNINSAVSNAANINTVAGISGNVTTVAGISSDVTTVANDATDIGNVSGSIANVNTVAGISSNVTTVANNNSNVTAVAGNATNINAAVSNASNINAAVSNASNINAAVTNAANITAVADNETNINAVKNNATNINAAVSNASNINSAVSNASNINTVAGISGNVTTVASNNSNVTTVAGSIANVNTTAGSIANVNTTANAIANVNTTAGSIANVNTTAGSIANVNTVATNITNVNNASTYLNNFLSLYLGTAASAPTLDALGNPVTEGDLYFNTGTKQLNIFNGSVFTNIVDTALDFAKSATATFSVLYTASVGSNSIDLGGLAITGAAFANEEIATNRVSLAKGSGTFNLGGI